MERATMTLRGRVLRASGAALLLAGLAGCVAIPPGASSAPLRAVAVQDGDRVTVETAATGVTLDILSERGIGRVEVERTGEMPAAVTFRLRLKGLEEFSLAWDDVRVTGHVSNQDGTPREEVRRPSAPAAAIDATSPYWLPVRIEAADPAIPLQDGFFVLAAPPAFIKDAPERFTLQWIDFYR